jgi:hypothetical protein
VSIAARHVINMVVSKDVAKFYAKEKDPSKNKLIDGLAQEVHLHSELIRVYIEQNYIRLQKQGYVSHIRVHWHPVSRETRPPRKVSERKSNHYTICSHNYLSSAKHRQVPYTTPSYNFDFQAESRVDSIRGYN